MSPYDFLIGPFVEYGFMRRALVGSAALALGAGPVGVLLVLRRMSLMGDALAHAVLPGAALGYVVAGLSLPAMSLGGFVAGLATAAAAGLIARATGEREEASFAAFYLLALALGVLIVSVKGGNADLTRVLFGAVLAVDDSGLILVASVASATAIALALFYRPLAIECFDPGFLRALGGGLGASVHMLFVVLVVLNLVAAFQVLGTLMAVGLMVLPAAAARFWAADLARLMAIASAFALGASYLGLVASYHGDLPSGPAVVLAAGAIYLGSMVFGPVGSLVARRRKAVHLGG